jgi:hypothetical protein
VPEREVDPSLSCACPTPLPVERATRKGAAQTECLRCGRPVPLRLTAPRWST